MGNYKIIIMEFTKREQKIIKEIVNYDFSKKLGYVFIDDLLKKSYPKISVKFEEFTNKVISDVEAEDFFNHTNEICDVVDLFKLLDKLEKAGLILVADIKIPDVEINVLGNYSEKEDLISLVFNESGLPIQKFSKGLVFVTPELKSMVKNHFIDINKKTLIVGVATLIATIVLGIAALIK